jgi:hypothetical protein
MPSTSRGPSAWRCGSPSGVRAVDLWAAHADHAVRDRATTLDRLQKPCNIRLPQQHCGIVHSSYLCTEIARRP